MAVQRPALDRGLVDDASWGAIGRNAVVEPPDRRKAMFTEPPVMYNTVKWRTSRARVLRKNARITIWKRTSSLHSLKEHDAVDVRGSLKPRYGLDWQIPLTSNTYKVATSFGHVGRVYNIHLSACIQNKRKSPQPREGYHVGVQIAYTIASRETSRQPEVGLC
ncbi:hypothetical protein BD410DRAFT_878888 [Rickenella mellea]|uniref:Uncharacterized protein n=1 Tax=Rickenella mellea TaxID=50990 RepID=A0A4Y7QJ28_9AGAM|nr:hypothetical protein BD410DRAFT_878888 [Rickenella mellea]